MGESVGEKSGQAELRYLCAKNLVKELSFEYVVNSILRKFMTRKQQQRSEIRQRAALSIPFSYDLYFTQVLFMSM